MPFQTTVTTYSGSGVQGEYFNNTPFKATSFIINSASAAYNIIGATAMSLTAQGQVAAGLPDGAVYQGILANPKGNASFGGSAGPLSPNLTLPNESQSVVVQWGSMFVYLPNTANIGDVVIFNTTTGALASQAPGTALPSGFANANAYVDQYTVTAAGLAVITLAPNAPTLSAVPEVVIGEGKVTWSGSGATLAVTVAGALTTDTVLATIDSAPTQAAYLVAAQITSANTLTLTLSAANTSNDGVIGYRISRA